MKRAIDSLRRTLMRVIPLGVLGTSVYASITVYRSHGAIPTWLRMSDGDLATLLAVIITLATLGLTLPFVLRYLTTGQLEILSIPLNINQTRRIQRLELQLKHLRSASAGAGEGNLQTQRAALKSLKEELRNELTREITERLHAEVVTESYTARCREAFKKDESRLGDQIDKLRYRSNLNLAFGVGTTLVSMGMLIWTVSGVSGAISDNRRLTAYFISRISTVIFLEVFSFFFLRLYRTTLEEEKFYQNEMTARSARYIALEAAFRLGDDETNSAVVQSFASFKPSAIASAESASTSDTQLKDIAESATKILLSIVSKSDPK